MMTAIYLLVETNGEKFSVPLSRAELSRLSPEELGALAPYCSTNPEATHLRIEDASWVVTHRKVRGLHGFFMGRAMKETGSAADPRVLGSLIEETVSLAFKIP